MSVRISVSVSNTLNNYLQQASYNYGISRQRVIYDCIIARVKHERTHSPRVIFPTNHQYRTMRSNLEKIGEQLDELNKNLEDKAKATSSLVNYGISDINTNPKHKESINGFFSSDMHRIYIQLAQISKMHQSLSRTIDRMCGYDDNYYEKKAARKSHSQNS